jgi:low affinity Fe/Cu permease
MQTQVGPRRCEPVGLVQAYSRWPKENLLFSTRHFTFNYGYEMQKSTAIALLISLVAIAGTCNVTSAQEKTRAQVRQELIEAENNGIRLEHLSPERRNDLRRSSCATQSGCR